MKKNIEELIKDYNKLTIFCDSVLELFGNSPESKFFDIIWEQFEKRLSFIEETFKTEDWISWYIYDNECGKGKLEAGFKDNMKKIENVDDLIYVIELTNKLEEKAEELKNEKK